MRNLLLAATALVALATSANAAPIISLGQIGDTNTVIGTANGAGTQTTITISNTPVLVDALLGVVTPPAIAAFMNFSATSFDSAILVGPPPGAILQHYNGTFCVSSAINCGGTIDLSGTFTDAAFGINGGAQLSINVASPPDALTLFSTVIPANLLGKPASFTLSLADLAGLSIQGNTIASFGASFSAVASANPVPEPASLAVLGAGLVGLGMTRRKRRGSVGECAA